MFADDSNVFVNGKTVDEVIEKTNTILSKIKLYLDYTITNLNVFDVDRFRCRFYVWFSCFLITQKWE